MEGVPFRDPSHPVKIPVRMAVGAVLRIVAFRSLPIKWVLAIAAATCRLDLAARPGRYRALLKAMASVAPGQGGPREVGRHLVVSRALRKVGGYTYAPVFARPVPWLLRTLHPEGLEHLDAIKESGGGAVILGTHIGLNSWVGPTLMHLGYPVRLTQRQRVSVDAFLLLRREGALPNILPFPAPGEGGPHLKKLHGMLRSGTWLQHVGDFADYENGLHGTLMGRPVRCVAGPWALARLARVPVVPCMLVTDMDYNCRLRVCPPISVEPAASVREGLEQPFQTYLDYVSAQLRATPWCVGLKNWQKHFAEDGPQDETDWD